MTATVATSRHLGVAKGQNRVTFRNPRGNKNYYCLYGLDGTVPTVDAEVQSEYSTDGSTWSNTPQTVINFGSASGPDPYVSSFDVKIRDTGSQLDIWVVASGWNANDLALQNIYCYGYIGDSDTDITWSTEQDIHAALNSEGLGNYCVAIARTYNGRIVVAFSEDYNTMGKDYRLTKLIGSDGDGASPSWSGEITWNDPSSDSNNQSKDEVWFGLESYDSSYPNRVFLYARLPQLTDTATYDIATAVPDWNGSVFSNTGLGSWATPYVTTGNVISGLIDDADIAHIVYLDRPSTTDLAHRKSSSAGDDNMGSSTAIITGVNIAACTLTLDTGPATDVLYIFYRNLIITDDWGYRTSPVDVISFSSEYVVSYHQHMLALSSWSRQVENSLHIAGLHDTTVIYNEHPVYKALSTTLADLEFPDQNYYLGPHST